LVENGKVGLVAISGAEFHIAGTCYANNYIAEEVRPDVIVDKMIEIFIMGNYKADKVENHACC